MGGSAFEEWAVVELMGHVRMAGRVTEEQRFGATLGRVDIPKMRDPCVECGGRGHVLPGEGESSRCPACEGSGLIGEEYTTIYFGGGSIYRLTPTTEALIRDDLIRGRRQPLYALTGPSRPSPGPHRSYDSDDDSDDDDDRDDLDMPF